MHSRQQPRRKRSRGAGSVSQRPITRENSQYAIVGPSNARRIQHLRHMLSDVRTDSRGSEDGREEDEDEEEVEEGAVEAAPSVKADAEDNPAPASVKGDEQDSLPPPSESDSLLPPFEQDSADTSSGDSEPSAPPAGAAVDKKESALGLDAAVESVGATVAEAAAAVQAGIADASKTLADHGQAAAEKVIASGREAAVGVANEGAKVATRLNEEGQKVAQEFAVSSLKAAREVAARGAAAVQDVQDQIPVLLAKVATDAATLGEQLRNSIARYADSQKEVERSAADLEKDRAQEAKLRAQVHRSLEVLETAKDAGRMAHQIVPKQDSSNEQDD